MMYLIPRRSFSNLVKVNKELLGESSLNYYLKIECEDMWTPPNLFDIYHNIILSYHPKEKKRLLYMLKNNFKFLPNLHITDDDIFKKYSHPRL